VKINQKRGKEYKPEMGCSNCSMNCGACEKGGEA